MPQSSLFRVLGRRSPLVWFVPALLLLTSRPSFAGPPDPGAATVEFRPDGELTDAAQRTLAGRFAPTLIYHRDEKFFPTSPLFPIEDDVRIGQAPVGSTSIEARLGNVDQRREFYEKLSPQGKEALARVYYRAYPSRLDEQPVIVIEYWLYYVQNDYRVRFNLPPFWVESNHPNDLEHIHVVVRRDDTGAYVVHEVLTSAHSGTMPVNRRRFADGEGVDRTRVIVELGSHASAPDVDGDGLFTKGTDAVSGYKMLWGIRDRGIIWPRYNSTYMDARTTANSVVFEYEGGASRSPERLQYRLVPVTDLESAFSDLDLSTEERRALFENHRNWFRRMFGGNNGRSSELLVPPTRQTNTHGVGFERFAATERGFLVGTQLNMEQQGVYAGARYSFLLGGTYVPDVMFEADAIVSKRTRYLTGHFLVTYPLDGSATLMFGKAVVYDATDFDRRQWDWLGGVEFPVGHMRVFFATRSYGPVTRYSQEVRLSYFF